MNTVERFGRSTAGRALALVSAAVLAAFGAALFVIAVQNERDARGFEYQWQPSKPVGVLVMLGLTAAALCLLVVSYTILYSPRRGAAATMLFALIAIETAACLVALAVAVFGTLELGWSGAGSALLAAVAAVVPVLVAVRLEREPPRLAKPAPTWARITSVVILVVGLVAALALPVRGRHNAQHAFYYPFGVLPAAVQPPDACALLTDAEVSKATGQKMVSHGPSLLADPRKGVRACFWLAPGGHGLFSVALSTQEAVAAAGSKDDLRHLFDALKGKGGVPVTGVGVDALFTPSGQAGTLDVLLNDALVQIDDSAHTPARVRFEQQDLAQLAKLAADRLNQQH